MPTRLDEVEDTVIEAVRLAAGLDALSGRVDADGDPHFAATITTIASLLRTCAMRRLPEGYPVTCRAAAP